MQFAEAAEDLESEALRKSRVARGYARDRAVEPALMPLNSVLVGKGLMELIAYVTSWRSVVPFSRFDASRDVLVRQAVDRNPDCPVCAPAHAMAERQDIFRYALD